MDNTTPNTIRSNKSVFVRCSGGRTRITIVRRTQTNDSVAKEYTPKKHSIVRVARLIDHLTAVVPSMSVFMGHLEMGYYIRSGTRFSYPFGEIDNG